MIFTGYPRWKLRTEGLPMEKIKTFPWLQTLYMGKGRFGISSPWFDQELSWWAQQTLDAYVARRLPNCDVFIGLSGSGLASGRMAKRRGTKYICDRGSSHIRFQDRILREEYDRWGVTFRGIDSRIMAKEEAEYDAADIVTVPSEFAYRTFIAEGIPKERVTKIPYGVDLSRFSKVAIPSPDSFDVLFVGQVSFRKGFPYLLEAFKRFRHTHKRLTVVGSVHPDIREYLSRQSMDEVVFLGPQPEVRLKEIMSASHVMVLPSIEEGLALVQAQAMACGCPVISSSHTGADDLFVDRREGFIVGIRDAQAITDRLENLAQNKELQPTMSAAAQARVKARGGWNAYGNAMIELFSRLNDRLPSTNLDPSRELQIS